MLSGRRVEGKGGGVFGLEAEFLFLIQVLAMFWFLFCCSDEIP